MRKCKIGGKAIESMYNFTRIRIIFIIVVISVDFKIVFSISKVSFKVSFNLTIRFGQIVH